MHPNSQLHHFLQQPALSTGNTANPLVAVLQSAGTGSVGVDGLTHPYSALGGSQQAAAVAAQQQQQPGLSARGLQNTAGGSDPYAAYSMLLSNNPAAAQSAMSTGNPPLNLPFLQQDQQVQQKLAQLDEEKIYTLVLELLNPSLREQALLDLSKKREQYDDLALILWYSYGKLYCRKLETEVANELVSYCI